MLLEPTEKYTNFIQGSKHYLNCPKHMFNYDLDCMYRQGCSDGKEISFVADYLKLYNYPKPFEAAKEFVEARSRIKLREFDMMNKNPYIENPPAWTIAKTERISAWTKAHTEYYPFSDVPRNQPSYPFKYNSKFRS